MLASGGAACCCGLPVLCLHFSLLNLASLVCGNQLASLLIRASPLHMSACMSTGHFLPRLPLGGEGTYKCSNCQMKTGNQSLWQKEKQRRRSEVGEVAFWISLSLQWPSVTTYQGSFSRRLITYNNLLSLTFSMFQSQLKWIRFPSVCLTVKLLVAFSHWPCLKVTENNTQH